jgi:hypothetical protein
VVTVFIETNRFRLENVNRPSENPRIPLGYIGNPQNVAPMADLSINST